jgi:NADH-quinone oxidoreductase subunit L
MLWPLVVLAVPSALLGLVVVGFGNAFPHWLGSGDFSGFDWVGGVALLAVAAGGLGAYRAWRRGTDPAPAVLADAFHLDAVQDALVVRPVFALARTVRRADQSLVDGAVESTGRGAFGLGGIVARWHRAALPRAATAVLGGALLIGLVAIAVMR